MLINLQQNNLLEEDYYEVLSQSKNEITLNKIPEVVINNSLEWILGWGTGIALYDAGFENTAKIQNIDTATNTITLFECSMPPEVGTSVVFWNTEPSNFVPVQTEPIISPDTLFPTFQSDGIGFGGVVYDSNCSKWFMLCHEADFFPKQWYLASSEDLIEWHPENFGNPIVSVKDIQNNKEWFDPEAQTVSVPASSSIIETNNGLVIFAQGYDHKGRSQIVYGTIPTLCDISWSIEFKPLLIDGMPDYDYHSPELVHYKGQYILFFTANSNQRGEQLYLAKSEDLISWTMISSKPILTTRAGWASASINAECVWAGAKRDTLFALVAGAKALKVGWYHHYITKRMYLDRKGNPYKTQLGMYYSIDTGKTWVAHANNPVWICDYSNPWQADHMGGDFAYLIDNDSVEYVVSQAKGRDKSYNAYNIFISYR